jgi:transcriptional regulator with XRE-family HTH domain
MGRARPSGPMLASERKGVHNFSGKDVAVIPHPAPAADARAAASAVLTKASLRSAELLGLSRATLARVVGISQATVSRMAAGERQFEIGSKPAELAALLVRVYRSLDALVGNSESHRRLWMSTYNHAFNQSPREAIESVDGLTRVVRYLDGARALV